MDKYMANCLVEVLRRDCTTIELRVSVAGNRENTYTTTNRVLRA